MPSSWLGPRVDPAFAGTDRGETSRCRGDRVTNRELGCRITARCAGCARSPVVRRGTLERAARATRGDAATAVRDSVTAMRYLAPHAVILAALLLLGRIPESVVLVLFVGGHLAVPVWTAWIAPHSERTRALLLGPVLVVAVHLLLIAATLIVLAGGFPEDTWLAYMMVMIWLAAVAIYGVYSIVAFGIVARLRR